jgi:hypothetical protein
MSDSRLKPSSREDEKAQSAPATPRDVDVGAELVAGKEIHLDPEEALRLRYATSGCSSAGRRVVTVSHLGASWTGTCCRSCVVSNDPTSQVGPACESLSSSHIPVRRYNAFGRVLRFPEVFAVAQRITFADKISLGQSAVMGILSGDFLPPCIRLAYLPSHQDLESPYGQPIQLAWDGLLPLVPRFRVPTKLGPPEVAGREMDEVSSGAHRIV